MPRSITPKTAAKKLAELTQIKNPSAYEKALIDTYRMITEQENNRINKIITNNMKMLEDMKQETFKNVGSSLDYSRLDKGQIVSDTINAMIEQVAINGAPQTAEMLRRTLAKERQKYGIDRVNYSMANAPEFLIESINRAISYKYKNEGKSAVTQMREVIEGSIPTAQEMREMNETEEAEYYSQHEAEREAYYEQREAEREAYYEEKQKAYEKRQQEREEKRAEKEKNKLINELIDSEMRNFEEYEKRRYKTVVTTTVKYRNGGDTVKQFDTEMTGNIDDRTAEEMIEKTMWKTGRRKYLQEPHNYTIEYEVKHIDKAEGTEDEPIFGDLWFRDE